MGLDIEQMFDYTLIEMERPILWPASLGPMISGRSRPGIRLALGPRRLPAWFLARLVPVLARGARFFWIDGGNSFEAYGAGHAARGRGLDARRALANVRLARPFNLFQLETIVSEKLPALWRGEPVVLSEPLPLFYDEDVPAARARAVLARTISAMLKLPAVWLVLLAERRAPRGRGEWLEHLKRPAAALSELRSAGGGLRLERLEG